MENCLNIAKALVKAQSEMSNPVKGADNPFFRSKYADLNAVREAILPVLNSNGIVVLQPMVNIEGKNFVKTVLLHESGESIESVTEILYSKPNDAQAQGSGISYARRYGLQSLVCVGAEDDDANGATPQNAPAKSKKEAVASEKEWEDKITKCQDLKELEEIWFNGLPKELQPKLLPVKNRIKEQLIQKTPQTA